MNPILQASKSAFLAGADLARRFDQANPEFARPLGQSLEKQYEIEMLSYLLYLSESAQKISEQRADYINEILDKDYRADDLSELSRRLALHDAKFSTLIPTLLKAAALMDQNSPAAGPSYKDQVIRIFRTIGENAQTYCQDANALEELDREIYLLSLENWAHDQKMAGKNRNGSQSGKGIYSDILDKLQNGKDVIDPRSPLNSPSVSSSRQSGPNPAAMRKPGEEKKKEPEEKEPEKLEDLLAELNALTGLKGVKDDVSSLINLLKIRKIRRERNMKDIPVSMHLVFTGNPGTGKTTVARLLARIYHSLGALSKGQLVEVDRSELVGGYVGQTAMKTQEVTDSALGGVLFIDEAYALTAGKDKQDFGYEAVDTLLVEMENHRDDLAVIVAGYPEPMKEFLQSNPGLKSRFNKFIDFPDYTPDELFEIFDGMVTKSGYKLSEDAIKKAKRIFSDLYAFRDENFANGRTVRNFFEKVMVRQANRLASLEELTNEQLEALEADDLPEDGLYSSKTSENKAPDKQDPEKAEKEPADGSVLPKNDTDQNQIPAASQDRSESEAGLSSRLPDGLPQLPEHVLAGWKEPGKAGDEDHNPEQAGRAGENDA